MCKPFVDNDAASNKENMDPAKIDYRGIICSRCNARAFPSKREKQLIFSSVKDGKRWKHNAWSSSACLLLEKVVFVVNAYNQGRYCLKIQESRSPFKIPYQVVIIKQFPQIK